MLYQPQPIGRVMVLVSSVGLLLAIFGCVVVLAGMADRSLPQAPELSADAKVLTRTAPGRHAMLIAHRDHAQPQDGFVAQRAATITPVEVDRSFDLRTDLRDMAISLRCHCGVASDLPLGSNITGTSAG